MLREGKHSRDIAKALNRPDAEAMIGYIGKRYGIIPIKHGHGDVGSARNAEITMRYRAGDVTLLDLAKVYGITRERIRQIILHFERKSEERLQAIKDRAGVDRMEDIPLTALVDLPVRAQNCFKNDNIHTVGEAMQISDWQLLRTPNFGKQSLADWHRCLKELQQSWK